MTVHLLDVNVLIALAWPSHVHHRRAHAWWSTVNEWATTPVTESAFVRLSSNPTVVGVRVTVATAVQTLRAIRSTPGHRFIDDATTLADPRIDLSRVVGSSQVTDAHLVNVAASAGAVLATLDRAIPGMLEPHDRRHVLVLP